MFVPPPPKRTAFFLTVYQFVNLTLTDKHGTKTLQGLIHPWLGELSELGEWSKFGGLSGLSMLGELIE